MAKIYKTEEEKGIVGFKFDKNFQVEIFEKKLGELIDELGGVRVVENSDELSIQSRITYHQLSSRKNIEILRDVLLELCPLIEDVAKNKEIKLHYYETEDDLEANVVIEKSPSSDSDVNDVEEEDHFLTDVIRNTQALYLLQDSLEYTDEYECSVEASLDFNNLIKETHSLGKKINSSSTYEFKEELYEFIVENLNKDDKNYFFYDEFISSNAIREYSSDCLYDYATPGSLKIPEFLFKVKKNDGCLNWIEKIEDNLMVRFEENYENISFWYFKDKNFDKEIKEIFILVKENIGKLALKHRFKK